MNALNRAILASFVVIVPALTTPHAAFATDEPRFGPSAAQITPVVLDKEQQIVSLLTSQVSNDQKARELRSILGARASIGDIQKHLGLRYLSGGLVAGGMSCTNYRLDGKTRMDVWDMPDGVKIEVTSRDGKSFVLKEIRAVGN